MSPLAQDRKILADSRPIYDLTGNLVHSLICSAQRSALLYSGTEFKSHSSHDLVLPEMTGKSVMLGHQVKQKKKTNTKDAYGVILNGVKDLSQAGLLTLV